MAHDNNIQKRVQLMNAATERHRLEGYFHLGQVPAHISHPLARSILKLQSKEPKAEPASDSESSSLMDVDEEEDVDVASSSTGLVPEMGQRGDVPRGTQPTTMADANKRGLPNMGPFSDREMLVGAKSDKGVADRLLYPEAIASRNIKVIARNVESRRRFANTDAKRLATVAKRAATEARRAAKRAAA